MQINITTFGPKGSSGSSEMKNLLGGKGANLCGMSSLGVSVPPGFIIPTEVSLTSPSEASLAAAIQQGLAFISSYTPGTLVSVRSGARVSMPGMMDTILNVGITPANLPALKAKLGDRAALDCYRRLIHMYATVALGASSKDFDALLDKAKAKAKAKSDSDLSAKVLEGLVDAYMGLVTSAGLCFPDTIEGQIIGAVRAVFQSWDNPRAYEYRSINSIPYEWGTAAIVQAMVFGNLNDQSATGVLFTRNPSTGENVVTGEYLINAQGEDVVAGIRTPDPLTQMAAWNADVYAELLTQAKALEAHYGDMQDIEFTVQDSKLYILQTRNGKRSAAAAFQIAIDLVDQGLLTPAQGLGRVNADQLLYLMKDRIDPSFDKPALVTGIAAGGAIATGKAVFSSASAVNCTVPCILVTKETDPDDIAGMFASVGILTAMGGLTSHAAVVARGMNKACVVGATSLTFKANKAMAGDEFGFNEGDIISIDGSTGRVWKGEVPMITGQVNSTVRAVVTKRWEDQSVAEVLEVSPTSTLGEVDAAVSSLTSTRVYINLDWVDPKLITVLGDLLRVAQEHKGFTSVTVVGKQDSAGSDAFATMFGVPTSKTFTQINPAWGSLVQWGSALRKITTVMLPGPAPDNIATTGLKVSGRVGTFEDLLTMTGPISVDPDVIVEVFGSEKAYKAAIEMIQKTTGKEFPASVTPSHWYQPLLASA